MTEEEKAAAAAAASSQAVEEVDFDNLDELLGISTNSVIAPDSVKPTVFKSDNVNVDFLDDDNMNDPDKLKDVVITKDDISSIVDSNLEDGDDEEDDEEPVNKGGRPRLTKDAMIEAASRLIEKGILVPFEDDKPISDYTVDDFEELIQANIDNKVSETAQNAPVELFQTLPEEVQAVVHYALNGGTDTKAVFKQLSQVQETFDLDVAVEKDQETIVRQWMQAIGSDTSEEIEDEINLLKDRGDLEKYAQKYKPKLDAKQAEIIQKRLNDQQQAEVRKQDQIKHYQQNVYNALNTTDLNGVPLPAKVQNALYYGLIDKRFQDSKGNPTNQLGYLLEQHQFGEKANPGLIAEALWLLSNPDEYRDSVKQLGGKDAAAKTMRMLKSEEASRTASTTMPTGSNDNGRRPAASRPALKKTGKSIFAR